MNHLLFDFEEAKKAYLHEPNPSLQLRSERIKRLVTMVNENEENLCKAISADFGQRNTTETKFAELTFIRQAAYHTLKNLKQWMKPSKVNTPFHLRPSVSQLIPESIGIVGIMSPWNYPLQLALVPVISAFAAGNRVWLKPSERSSRTSGYLASLIAQYFHPSELRVVCGERDISEKFAELPFDHLLFTGSTQAGKAVMKAAAPNLTPVTLELGGKSPCVIDNNVNLKDAVSRVVYGKFLNAGQTCIAPDYVLVPHQAVNDFISLFQDFTKKMYPNPSEQMTHPIDQRQLERWQFLVSDAQNKGAQITSVFSEDELGAYPFNPTLALNPSSDSVVMKEEIFGPILPIISYNTLEEAIHFINRFDRPLALYWFGKDKENMSQVLELTRAGGVTINDTLLHIANEDLPFGGIGASGIGSYHGKYGFDAFTHFKPVFTMKARFGIKALGGSKFIHPPYGKKIARLIKFLSK